MDLGSALTKRLDQDTALTALIGNRSYWLTRKQDDPLPAVVLQVISEERPQHLHGFEDMRTARVQVAAMAKSYGQSRKVMEAAIAALVPQAQVSDGTNNVLFWRALVEGPRDGSEEVTGLGTVYRPLTDLIIRYTIS